VEIAPTIGHVHVDDALGGPDPVVFPRVARCPLDSTKVDAPVGARRRDARRQAGCERSPGDGDLDSPGVVGVGGIVKSALDVDGGLKAGYSPGIVGAATLAVRLVEEEIPAGVEGVDFELEVTGVGERRLEEYLKVVVVEDDGVVLGERGLDVGLIELRGDIKVGRVVENFGSRPEPGKWLSGAFDVDEVGGPRGQEPGWVVEFAVDRRGMGREVAGIGFRWFQAGRSGRLELEDGGEDEDGSGGWVHVLSLLEVIVP